MTYTHKINADKVLKMGKGARKTWRLLELPESHEARWAVANRYLKGLGQSSPRRLYRAQQRNDALALIPPGDPWAYPEPAPGSDDYLKD